MNIVSLNMLFENQSATKTYYKYVYYKDIRGTPVNFFFRPCTELSIMANSGSLQVSNRLILSKEGILDSTILVIVTLASSTFSQFWFKKPVIPIFWY